LFLLAPPVGVVGFQDEGLLTGLSIGGGDNDFLGAAAALVRFELDGFVIESLSPELVFVAIAAAACQDPDCADSPVGVARRGPPGND
jgi:hypothetical protein